MWREFEEHGAKIRALNDRGDDSPEGELTEGILDQLAKFERAKTAERTRRGMLRKAREGRACSTRPKYGFRYNEARDGLLVYQPEMKVVEKIFRLAAEGLGFHAIQNRLLTEGVPTAKGNRVWAIRTLRKLLASDEYRPQSFEELERLVTPEVAAHLSPEEEYGIQWYNRQKVVVRTVAEPDGSGGRRYRKSRKFIWRPREEWLAIPVPAYLPRTLVDKAHAELGNHQPYERKHPARTWELRGLMRCGCGLKMSTRTAQPKGASRRYHYYECKRYRSCKEICPSFQQSFRPEKVEETVWSSVSRLLKDPERIKAGMEALIEEERANGPRHFAKEEATWAEKMAECSRLRGAYQDQQAAGLMPLDELGAKLKELESTREFAQAELDAIALRKERVEELQTQRDVLLESLANLIPEALDTLEPEERSRIYRMLQLEVIPEPQGFRVSGALAGSYVKEERHLPVGPIGQNFEFGALLAEDGVEIFEPSKA